ncbi:MAG TPA: chaperone modulator CbpM [Gammaproteobacteria bacterium]|nr:chaperone modulator CbpM [Gammaproteobacteria bacterium]
MPNTELLSGIIVEEVHSLTLDEFCQATHVTREIIIEMVDYQLIHPQGKKPEEWRFDSMSLKRGRLAASFYHELEINMPGVALALELMDKIQYLELKISETKKN